jgi:hypothetical protein
MEERGKWLLVGAAVLVSGLLAFKLLGGCKCTDCPNTSCCKPKEEKKA